MQGALERHGGGVGPSSGVLRSLGCPLRLSGQRAAWAVACTPCRRAQGSFGWEFLAAGSAPRGFWFGLLWAGRARLAVTARGAREERSGLQYSSEGVRRTTGSNALAACKALASKASLPAHRKTPSPNNTDAIRLSCTYISSVNQVWPSFCTSSIVNKHSISTPASTASSDERTHQKNASKNGPRSTKKDRRLRRQRFCGKRGLEETQHRADGAGHQRVAARSRAEPLAPPSPTRSTGGPATASTKGPTRTPSRAPRPSSRSEPHLPGDVAARKANGATNVAVIEAAMEAKVSARSSSARRCRRGSTRSRRVRACKRDAFEALGGFALGGGAVVEAFRDLRDAAHRIGLPDPLALGHGPLSRA